MSTIKAYLFPAHPLMGEATITSLEPGDHPRVRLNRTVFHVKGGGQLPDKGLLGDAAIVDVRHAPEGEVDHFVNNISDLHVGATVKMVVDAEGRGLNSRFHSAGHAIASVVADRFPSLRAVQGHHYPGEARVEFEGDTSIVERVREELTALIADAVRADYPVRVLGDPERDRSIQIANFLAIPCGGTHIDRLSELINVEITAVKIKSGRLRVSYHVG